MIPPHDAECLRTIYKEEAAKIEAANAETCKRLDITLANTEQLRIEQALRLLLDYYELEEVFELRYQQKVRDDLAGIEPEVEAARARSRLAIVGQVPPPGVAH